MTASVMAFSDGSFKETCGTAAWIIGTEDYGDMISGRAICPGGPTDQSAYRSELSGLYSILAVIHQLCLFYEVKEGQVEIGCDGSAALRIAFGRDPILSSDIPDFDLVGAIYSLRRESTVTWSHRHVKGHQDELSDDLDIWATRNVLMDKRAKEHFQVAQKSERHFTIEGEPWQLWVDGSKVTVGIIPKIYSTTHAASSEAYWERKFNMTPEVIKQIDWQLIGESMRSIPRARQIFIMKHTSGMCGVGKFMKRWREWDQDSCPRCGMPEDAPHVWRCKGGGTAELWNKAVEDLTNTLRQLETDPTLQHIITFYLHSWWSGETTSYEAPTAFYELLQEQQQIGWDRFFEGWWSEKWASIQQQYYNLGKSTRTGRRWATAIVTKLWNIAWDLWEHRNGILHEGGNLITQSMTVQLNARVSWFYNDLSSRALRQYDRYLVHHSLYTLLRKDNNYKITWLLVAEPVIRSSRLDDWRENSRTDQTVNSMRRCMFAWLRR